MWIAIFFQNITKSFMQNPKNLFIFMLDIILLVLEHLVNVQKSQKFKI
jgi:hypothetical protein